MQLKTKTNFTPFPIKVYGHANKKWKLKTPIFDEGTSPYSSCLVFAKKFSGKSNLIANMFMYMASPKTQLILCQATQQVDETTLDLRKQMKEQGYKDAIVYDDVVDSQGRTLLEILKIKYAEEQTIIEEKKRIKEALATKGKLSKSETEKLEQRLEQMKASWEDDTGNGTNNTYDAPHFFIWIDDISNTQLRSIPIFDLIKMSRQYKAFLVISCHDLKNAQPQTFKQMNFVFVGKHVNQDTLRTLFERLDLADFTLSDFVICYMDATKQQFGFLQIGIDRETLAKGFREKVYMKQV